MTMTVPIAIGDKYMLEQIRETPLEVSEHLDSLAVTGDAHYERNVAVMLEDVAHYPGDVTIAVCVAVHQRRKVSNVVRRAHIHCTATDDVEQDDLRIELASSA